MCKISALPANTVKVKKVLPLFRAFVRFRAISSWLGGLRSAAHCCLGCTWSPVVQEERWSLFGIVTFCPDWFASSLCLKAIIWKWLLMFQPSVKRSRKRETVRTPVEVRLLVLFTNTNHSNSPRLSYVARMQLHATMTEFTVRNIVISECWQIIISFPVVFILRGCNTFIGRLVLPLLL